LATANWAAIFPSYTRRGNFSIDPCLASHIWSFDSILVAYALFRTSGWEKWCVTASFQLTDVEEIAKLKAELKTELKTQVHGLNTARWVSDIRTQVLPFPERYPIRLPLATINKTRYSAFTRRRFHVLDTASSVHS
jgi:hypothetical protein